MKLIYPIALTKIKGIGPRTARSIIAHSDSLADFFSYSKKDLMQIPGVRESIADAIHNKTYLEACEKELAFIDKHRIKALWIEDKDYPDRLKQCDDAPLMLYYKGHAALNSTKVISIVGTRDATHYGQRLCEDFMQGLNENQDLLIVSGLAYGIDALAHRNALKNNIPTVAVLGHGLDRIYPASHRELASKMLEHGGLLTEFTSETIPERVNFPMRNRIIAGMADVTIVVEAAIKGGALITAEIANSYNRDVCAFPGSIYEKSSEGTNYLIKTNRAHMIRHVQDLEYLMNWEISKKNEANQQLTLSFKLDKDQERLFNLIHTTGQLELNQMIDQLQWPQSKLALVLLELEMQSLIHSLPGKVYKSLGQPLVATK
ncbi:DNA-processing protein DprA [Sphingobacterium sp. BIGb0165]|uniref:DNA-processing protein DprA n=1 Tax=Sphingobacterium sp. BIGb0165 TaxID=2940615 RepID=UPI00216A7C86|nr:DNA-processing protein DprA [Sphingobacterium sp. BIGb0165]MCS4228185.1 DNA processing protein [Sphingobacterium sp. BIGb0165]